MNEKPSDGWIKISFFTIILLIVLSIFLIVNSFIIMEKRVNQSSENQLTTLNEYVINILQQNIDKYDSFLQEIAYDLVDNLEESEKNTFENSDIEALSKMSNGELEGIFVVGADGDVQDSLTLKDKMVQNKPLSRVYLSKDPSLSKVLDGNPIRSGKEYFHQNKSYINLYAPILNREAGQTLGYVVVPFNLQELYDTKIKIKNNTFNGYSMIKNADLQVLMHPAKEQIGLSIVEDRKEKYPELDFSGLKKLEENQLSHTQGNVYYESYWWNEKSFKEVLKLSVFKWITIGDAKWVVATNTDVQERKGIPLQRKIIIFTVLIIIIILLSLFFYLLHQYQINYQLFMKFKESEKIRIEQAQRFELEKTLLQESKLETIGIVTTTIVHDLNNILTPMIGLTQLLMDEHTEDVALMSDLESIYTAAIQGQDLSKNILRFSKVENNRRVKENDIVEVVEESIKNIRPLIPKHIALKLSVQEEIRCLSHFEEQDLQVMLFNLITNSYQAIGKEKGTVDIMVTKIVKDIKEFPLHFDNKQLIAVKVVDDGPGIPQEIQEQVLNTPFFSTKGNDGGTGLGLFVVTSIAKKYGWQIELLSENQGTTFIIYIPV